MSRIPASATCWPEHFPNIAEQLRTSCPSLSQLRHRRFRLVIISDAKGSRLVDDLFLAPTVRPFVFTVAGSLRTGIFPLANSYISDPTIPCWTWLNSGNWFSSVFMSMWKDDSSVDTTQVISVSSSENASVSRKYQWKSIMRKGIGLLPNWSS